MNTTPLNPFHHSPRQLARQEQNESDYDTSDRSIDIRCENDLVEVGAERMEAAVALHRKRCRATARRTAVRA
jgi:hypothetical protein